MTDFNDYDIELTTCPICGMHLLVNRHITYASVNSSVDGGKYEYYVSIVRTCPEHGDIAGEGGLAEPSDFIDVDEVTQ